MENKFLVIYVTFKDRQEADKIVDSLISKKLIACANYLGIEARYFWKTEVVNAAEVAALLKTKLENWEGVKSEVIRMHSYEIPCIIKYEVEANKEYADWVKSETNI